MKYLLLIASVVISGCATLFPTAVREVQDGVYLINTNGNAFSSFSRMHQKVEDKARAICGDQRVEYQDALSSEWLPSNNYLTERYKSQTSVTIVIRCVDSAHR